MYASDDFPLAIRMLQKSTELEPGYAPAWASLGRAHSANASFEFGGTNQLTKGCSTAPLIAEVKICHRIPALSNDPMACFARDHQDP